MDAAPALAPDAVTAICRHMNDDHRAEGLLICQALAGAGDVAGLPARGH